MLNIHGARFTPRELRSGTHHQRVDEVVLTTTSTEYNFDSGPRPALMQYIPLLGGG